MRIPNIKSTLLLNTLKCPLSKVQSTNYILSSFNHHKTNDLLSLVCFTQDIMKDPVILCESGVSYERENIILWMNDKG